MKAAINVGMALTVHPHVCGEHLFIRSSSASVNGSSPRVWGTFVVSVIEFVGLPVHPHVCGEHSGSTSALVPSSRFIPTCVGNMFSPTAITQAYCGSSPRVWGTCAPALGTRAVMSVHPHVCGEHFATGGGGRSCGRFIPTCVGNMRVWYLRWFPPSRFIPTCVGNIICIPINFFPTAVHPHVCGEHVVGISCSACCYGSSPRVWGTCA